MAMTSAARVRARGAAAGLVGAIAGITLFGGDHRDWTPPASFHFRDAPAMIDWQARTEAEAFVASRIKPGTPLPAALQAAAEAGAPCRRPQDPGEPIVCSYVYMDQLPTGDLGENEWRIEIVPGADGKVDHAEVSLHRAGL